MTTVKTALDHTADHVSRSKYIHAFCYALCALSTTKIGKMAERERARLWCGRPGLGKIDYNRYSIAIFLTFFQSNTPDPLLFGMSIEYAVFFSFFQVKTIFDFFFQKAMHQQMSKHSEEDY